VQLGSGGGVSQLLVDAWRADGSGADFGSWLSVNKRLAMLAGGQSRRLPAYAATGKVLMPIPVIQGTFGQRLDQTLLDLQAADYRRVLEQSPESARLLVASGDVFLRFPKNLPPVPAAADISSSLRKTWTPPPSSVELPPRPRRIPALASWISRFRQPDFK